MVTVCCLLCKFHIILFRYHILIQVSNSVICSSFRLKIRFTRASVLCGGISFSRLVSLSYETTSGNTAVLLWVTKLLPCSRATFCRNSAVDPLCWRGNDTDTPSVLVVLYQWVSPVSMRCCWDSVNRNSKRHERVVVLKLWPARAQQELLGVRLSIA